MINEEEALKIILAKHSTDLNVSLSSNPLTDERTSEISDMEGKSSDSECANQSEMNIGNSLNKRSGWSFDEKDTEQIVEEKHEQTDKKENHNAETSKLMEHSYNALIESYNMLGGSTIRTPILSDLMQKLESINKENDDEKIVSVFTLFILFQFQFD